MYKDETIRLIGISLNKLVKKENVKTIIFIWLVDCFLKNLFLQL